MYKFLLILFTFLFASPSFAAVVSPSSPPPNYTGALSFWRSTAPNGSYYANGINWPVPYWLYSGATPNSWDYYTPSSCYWDSINSPQQYYCQLQVDQYTLVSSCPSGTVKSTTSSVCIVPPPATCSSDKFSVHGVCVSNPCGNGKSISKVPNEDGICRAPTAAELLPYKDDARLCHLHGGFTTFKSPVDLNLGFPKSILTFQNPINQCLPVSNAVADRNMFLGVSLATGPVLNKMFPSLGVFIDKAIDKAGLSIKNLLEKVDPLPFDFKIGVPRIGPGGAIDTEIITSPIPDGPLGDAPSRGPSFDLDGYNAFLRNEWFPKNPNSINPNDPYIDMATLDRFSKANLNFKDNGTDPVTFTFKSDTANIWKSTRGTPTTEPLMDGPVFEAVVVPKPSFTPLDTVSAPQWKIAPSTDPAPPPTVYKYADIPVEPTVTTSPSPTGNGNVVEFKNTRRYPDGSTSLETTKIDEQQKRGTNTITTIAPNGGSSTISRAFEIPKYVPGSIDPAAYDVAPISPVATTPLPIPYTPSTPYSPAPIDPITGYPAASTVTPGSNTLPSTATGQDLINAPMPSYSFPALTEFVPFDSTPVTDMINGANLMFTNIGNQISSTKSVFDNTKAMLNGGWTPPVIPAGSCGQSLAFNFHGKHIDLCPPLVNATAVGAPIVAPVVTIGGMVLSVTIMLGGF